jgi:hypothetical protein
MRRVALLALLFPAACASQWPTPDALMTLKPPAVMMHRHTGVRVHVDTRDPLLLACDGPTPACKAPCDAVLPVGSTCRLRYDNSYGSRDATQPFVLDVPEGTVATIAIGPVAPPNAPAPGVTLNLF